MRISSLSEGDSEHQVVAGSRYALQTSSRTHLVLVALSTALLAVLSFHALDAKTFWFDEAASVQISRLDWYNFARILWRREGNMSLYYLVLRFWLHLGSTPFFVRTLSVLFALATVPTIYLLGRRLFNARVGLIASALLTVNAYEVRYAQEARSYSLMVLLCTLSSLFLLKWIENPSQKNRAAYALTSVLAIYAHFFSALLIVAQWLWLYFRERNGTHHRREWAWILGFSSPVFVFIVATGAGPLRWIPHPEVKDLWRLAVQLCGNEGGILVDVYAVACVAAFLPRRADAADSEVERWSLRFLLSWLILPIAIVLAISPVRPLFVIRYFIVSVPALILLAAAGLSRVRSNAVLACAILAVSALSIRGDISYYRRDFDVQREDWRAATQFLLKNSAPGDALVFHIPMGRMPYEYYRSLQPASSGPEILYPNHGGSITFLDFVEKPDYSFLQRALPQHPRVWLVRSHAEAPTGIDSTGTGLADLIAANKAVTRRLDFNAGLDIVLYAKPRATP